LTAPPHPIGDPNRYTTTGDDTPPEPVQNKGPGAGRSQNSERPWQNWDRWSRPRIESILRHETRRQNHNTARQTLARHLATLGDSLLDVGCGPGALWPHLQPLGPGFSWLGLDVTPQMLAVAAHYFPQAPLVQADAGFLPLVQGSFDVVLLRHLLEHLPDWLMKRVLSEAMRVGRQAVVLAFHRPPLEGAPRQTRRVGENFLETRWTVTDLQEPIKKAGWQVQQQLSLHGRNKRDQAWILAPAVVSVDKPAGPVSHQALNGNPKFSIIMPTYRRPHTVRRTVDSILAQSFDNWELIIIDNAGDGDLRFSDPRIQVYRHVEQASASYARNQGLAYARGELLCFFDDDDDMFPHYLARFAAAFQEQPQAKIVRGGMIVSDGRVNYSYATPECCLRREHATPSWRNRGPAQDQRYFRRIIRTHGWTESAGDIVIIREALCRANADPEGGLRSGNY
jgi:SAM-dependent methyltransferase